MHFCRMPTYLRPTALVRLLVYCSTIFSFALLIYSICKTSRNPISLWKPENKTLVSYENHTLAEEEENRSGPGEQGLPLKVKADKDTRLDKYRYRNGFDGYVSSLISIDRSVRDIRHPKCKTMRYRLNLPTVSIIIPVFQEEWYTLLRTFRSALRHAPPGLIKEIILSDDGSTRPFLKKKLDDYLADIYPDNLVRVIRSPVRRGLIDARIRGAKVASGNVLVFLDSHCETAPNWLVPLLNPIKEDYRTVTCPLIDSIDADTFEFRAQREWGSRGILDWQFYYKHVPKLPEDLLHPERPYPNPIMEGGLFAISSKWFWELGGYDSGLKIWGGEQYEMSFKLWMCGGKLLNVPCSRIGHVYRKYKTDFWMVRDRESLGRNYLRVAKVWMDEYKKVVYNYNPHYRRIYAGDLTLQYAIRERLQCKPFKWFLKEVAPELEKHFPTAEPTPMARGDIRPLLNRNICIDATHTTEIESIRLAECIDQGEKSKRGIQHFEFGFRGEIRPLDSPQCWDAVPSSSQVGVMFFSCHGEGGNQAWKLHRIHDTADLVRISHVASNKCLEVNVMPPGEPPIILMPCDVLKADQKWIWKHAKPRKK